MHQYMNPRWQAPPPPERYPDLTACKMWLDDGYVWHMDFTRQVGDDRHYASDADQLPAIQWPWLDGFDPNINDWRVIGFVHISEHRPELPRTYGEPDRAENDELDLMADMLWAKGSLRH